MAGIPIVGLFGNDEICRDQFLGTSYREWAGQDAYAAAHYVNLGGGDNPVGGEEALPRDIRTYECMQLKVDEMFQLEKRYMELYKAKLEKEIKKEEQAKRKLANPEQKAQLQVIAAVRRFRERQKELARDEDTPEHQQKLVEMKQVTQASDLVCRMYLRRHQWSVPAACEQFFSTIGASTSTSSTPTALEIEYEQWMLAEHRLAAAADEDGELLKGLAVDGPPSNEGGHARE